MYFLLSINENFDDDLLQDVVEMIDYTAWFNMNQKLFMKLLND
jgi:hypothetical protein